MMQFNKQIKVPQTTIGVAKPYGRRLKKELAYLLSLSKVSLISSLKSVMRTEASSMVKIRKSIADSLLFGIHPHTQPNNQKKSSVFQRKTELSQTIRLFKPFFIHFSPNG